MSMKKIFAQLFLIVVMVFMCTTTSIAASSGDYSYKVLEDGTAQLTSYGGKATNVTVPATIDGYTVSSLNCFYVDDIVTVTIPSSVKRIEEKCFYHCEELKQVIFLGDGLEFIGDRAFFSCSLESFTIPSTVTTIEECAFGYAKFETITIPGSVTKCGTGLFYGTSQLKEIVFADGIITLWEDAIGSADTVTQITLPKTLQVIKKDALGEYATLSELVIPASVTSIEDEAFDGLSVNTLVANCKNVTMGSDAFSGLDIKSLRCYYNSVFHKWFKKYDSVKITFIDNPMIIKKSKLTVGVGSTTQVQLIGSGNITWVSSDKKVATVDSKGVVTAKKKGKATITATCDDGKQATCKITIKNNERNKLEKYSKKPSAYQKNMAGFGFSKIKRDSKGNYIISGHFLNNYSQSGTYLKNLTITVYKDGKKIAKQKYSKFNIKAPANSMKPVTIKINKSKITKKTTDLRNGKITIKVSGGILYR